MRAVLIALMLVAPLAFAQKGGPKTPAPPQTDTGARPGDDALTCEQIQAQMSTMTADSSFQGLISQQQTAAGTAQAQVVQNSNLLTPDQRAQVLAQLGAANATGANASTVQNAAGASPEQASGATQPSAAAQSDEPARKRGGMFKGLGKALGGVGGAFGGGRAVAAEQQRQLEAMAAAGNAAQEAARPGAEAQRAQLEGMSPQLMRGMHLAQLSQAKGCAAQPTPAAH